MGNSDDIFKLSAATYFVAIAVGGFLQYWSYWAVLAFSGLYMFMGPALSLGKLVRT